MIYFRFQLSYFCFSHLLLPNYQFFLSFHVFRSVLFFISGNDPNKVDIKNADQVESGKNEGK